MSVDTLMSVVGSLAAAGLASISILAVAVFLLAGKFQDLRCDLSRLRADLRKACRDGDAGDTNLRDGLDKHTVADYARRSAAARAICPEDFADDDEAVAVECRKLRDEVNEHGADTQARDKALTKILAFGRED